MKKTYIKPTCEWLPLEVQPFLDRTRVDIDSEGKNEDQLSRHKNGFGVTSPTWRGIMDREEW